MKFTSITKLTPGMRIGQNIIGISTEKYVVGYTLSEDDIVYLTENGIPGVYTMENAPAEILSPDLMLHCFSALRKKDFNSIISLAKQIVDELKARPTCLDFRSIRSYNEYILHHSVCVAVYAVSVGIRLGMVENQLHDLALAGLLHDIGLILTTPAALVKKDKLSTEEYEQIKLHPQEGYDFIKGDVRISSAVLQAVLQHHENINGTGYPERQAEDTISPYARILHVVDVYDAIMSKRPYKKGMSSADALNYLIGGKMILFDERIVDTFLEIAVPYPTGITVRLSNDDIALVVAQTNEPSLPVVSVEGKNHIINLADNTTAQDITIVADMEYEGTSNEAVLNAKTSTSNIRSSAFTGRKKKVMIVDDVFVSIAYTKRALGDDYDIITCLGGSKATSMAITEQPDLILMDYEMPDLDGVSAVNEIHKHGLNMPVIFLTGKCDKETVRACGRCGAVDYILKPANPIYLRTRVDMALYNIDTNLLL